MGIGKDTKGGIGQALKRMGQGKKGRGWDTGWKYWTVYLRNANNVQNYVKC